MKQIFVGGIPVTLTDSGEVQYEAGGVIDVDGDPKAYALPSSGLVGLDSIYNALHNITDDPENPKEGYVGVVVGEDKKPVKQTWPYPGYLISTTALQDHRYPVDDTRRYVWATFIPYISIPPQLEQLGVKLGDAALVCARSTAKSVQCVVGDIGPRRRLGEVSVACAEGIDIPSNPRNGGVSRGVIVRIFAGSSQTPAWSFDWKADDVAVFVDKFASRT